MKAAKNGSCCDGAETLDHSMEWRIFVQRAMNAAFIIVGGELDEDPISRTKIAGADDLPIQPANGFDYPCVYRKPHPY